MRLREVMWLTWEHTARIKIQVCLTPTPCTPNCFLKQQLPWLNSLNYPWSPDKLGMGSPREKTILPPHFARVGRSGAEALREGLFGFIPHYGATVGGPGHSEEQQGTASWESWQEKCLMREYHLLYGVGPIPWVLGCLTNTGQVLGPIH